MPKLHAPGPPCERAAKKRAEVVYITVLRGRDVITTRIAPALRVVREAGRPPRVEVLVS